MLSDDALKSRDLAATDCDRCANRDVTAALSMTASRRPDADVAVLVDVVVVVVVVGACRLASATRPHLRQRVNSFV